MGDRHRPAVYQHGAGLAGEPGRRDHAVAAVGTGRGRRRQPQPAARQVAAAVVVR